MLHSISATKRHCGLLFTLIITLSFTIAAKEANSNGDGEDLFNKYCSICHAGAMPEAPRLEAFKEYSAARIVDSLNFGVMSTQGLMLSKNEIRVVAEYLSGKPYTPKFSTKKIPLCERSISEDVGKDDEEHNWVAWGGKYGNKRFQAHEKHLSTKNVEKLELKWAFGFDHATRSRSQPTLYEGTLYIGGQNGTIYALDADSGCVHWSYETNNEVRGALAIAPPSNLNNGAVVFGDFKANIYALDRLTGELIWKNKVHTHPLATITGSVTVANNTVYVPISSSEVVPAAQASYPCCTFRGAVAALDILTGNQNWIYYTTPEPKPTGTNSQGTDQFGPSGAPIWSTPTYDPTRNLVYVTTGQNYSSPATGTSDAVIALNADNGSVNWIRQVWENDAWNGGCSVKTANCPKENGPDFDIGAAAILHHDFQAGDLVLVGQKSGLVFALDPEKQGEIVWTTRVGRGGTMGGVHWGMSANDNTLFVGISDLYTRNPYAEGSAQPGVHALNPADGSFFWRSTLDNQCPKDIKFLCYQGISAPVSTSPGLVFAGGLDGMLRAFDASNGKTLWEYPTARPFETINDVQAKGGAIEAAGPVIYNGHVYVTSGYDKWGEMPGNVLLVFGLPK